MPDRIKHTDMVTKTCPKLIIKELELGGGNVPGSVLLHTLCSTAQFFHLEHTNAGNVDIV